MYKLLTATVLIYSSALATASTLEQDLVAAAHERTRHTITYDGSYISITYPRGDVPDNIGVCTDVVIRSYRKLGVDLQQLIHEDMTENFSLYPSKRIWGLKSTDTNIDHRRVPNIQTFFTRYGQTLKKTQIPQDYHAGDIVTWMLPGNLPHIGIVTEIIHTDTGNPMIVHNIGKGPQLEDMLFKYKITGHYKYIPEKNQHK